jgi:uncharacterized protein (DUF305 family)
MSEPVLTERQREILDFIEAQQREIGQMQAWRLAWGATVPGAVPASPTAGPGGHEVPGEDMNH